jgi:hypothetical protein
MIFMFVPTKLTSLHRPEADVWPGCTNEYYYISWRKKCLNVTSLYTLQNLKKKKSFLKKWLIVLVSLHCMFIWTNMVVEYIIFLRASLYIDIMPLHFLLLWESSTLVIQKYIAPCCPLTEEEESIMAKYNHLSQIDMNQWVIHVIMFAFHYMYSEMSWSFFEKLWCGKLC